MPRHLYELGSAEAIGFRLIAALLAIGVFVVPHAILSPNWDRVVAFFGGPRPLFLVGITGTHIVALLGFNAIFTVLYTLRVPYFERFKISPKPWPWLQGPQQQAEMRGLLRLGVGCTALNLFLGTCLATLAYPMLFARCHFYTQADFPSILTTVWQLLFFILIEDAVFYCTHRTLHAVPFLYKHVHKLHHKYHHSIGLSAECTHPAEFLLGDSIPFLVGPLLVQAHAFTIMLWMFIRVWDIVDAHSGYDLPWVPRRFLPFASSADAHDAHHSLNTGNYGSMFVHLDKLFGTEIPPATIEEAIHTPRRNASTSRDLSE